jgi:hypothetical protein
MSKSVERLRQEIRTRGSQAVHDATLLPVDVLISIAAGEVVPGQDVVTRALEELKKMSSTNDTLEQARAAGFEAVRVNVVQGNPPPPLHVRMTVDYFKNAKAEAYEQGRSDAVAGIVALLREVARQHGVRSRENLLDGDILLRQCADAIERGEWKTGDDE